MVAGGGSGTITDRWQALGTETRLRLEAVDLWKVELPFRRPVVTAAGRHRLRPLALVRLTVGSGRRAIEGWGECAALADRTYHDEDVDLAFRALEDELLPGLWALAEAAHRLPGPSPLAELRHAVADHPLAFAAVEMAVADAHLRAEDRSFAELLGIGAEPVEVGAVVGLAPSTHDLDEQVTSLVAEGYRRIKLKIAPGSDFTVVEAATRAAARAPAAPPVRFQADANGSYAEEDTARLVELDRFGLLCLEQPFGAGRDDVAAHARLAARLGTPICLDESVGSGRDIERALAAGACSVVCLKPARLGGVGEALAVVERCTADGVPLWMGGMFESGYSRAVNTAIAALPGFRWPGDLSPAASYLGTDLVPPPLAARLPGTGALAVAAYRGPGMGESPDAAVVSSLAVEHVRIADD